MNRRDDERIRDKAHDALIAGIILLTTAASAAIYYKYIKPLLEWWE